MRICSCVQPFARRSIRNSTENARPLDDRLAAAGREQERLGLTPKGTWRSLKESRLSPQTAASILQLPSHPESDDYYPERYKYLAVHAFEQGKISQGRLARFLRCDPVTAREIVAQCLTSQYVEDDGQTRTLQLEFHKSLLAEAK